MKSLGNDYVLSARQLPFHLFVEGWPGTHISLGQGTNNCMGFSIAVLEDGDSISFPEVAARSITQSGQSGVDLLAAGNRLLKVLMGLQQWDEFAEENSSKAVQRKDTTSASERP